MRYLQDNINNHDLSLFGTDELISYLSFKSDKRKAEFYYTRVLWNTFSHTEKIKYDQQRRPFLDQGFISISHSRDIILIGFHPTHQVGVDVEYFSPKIKSIRDKFISVNDQQLINIDSEADITLVWSIKEAIFKMEQIEGISFKENIHVSFKENLGKVEVRKLHEIHEYYFEFQIRAEFVITFCSHENLNGKKLF